MNIYMMHFAITFIKISFYRIRCKYIDKIPFLLLDTYITSIYLLYTIYILILIFKNLY